MTTTSNLYQAVFEAAAEPMLILDQTQVIDGNAQVEILLGYPLDQLIGRSLVDISPPTQPNGQPTAKAFSEAMERVMNGSLEPFEWILFRADGDPGQFQLLPTKVTVANQTLSVISLKDQQEVIRRDEIQSFFALSRDLLCIAGMDGYFKFVNPAFEATLGWPIKELMAKPFADFVHPDDVQATIAETAKLGQGEPTIYFENRFLCRDGTNRWFAWTAQPSLTGAIYAVGRDITAVKQYEQDLEQSQSLLQTIVDATPDWIFIKDRAHRFQLVNRSYAQALRLAPEAVIGKNDLEVGFPEEVVKGNPVKGIRGYWADELEIMQTAQTKTVDIEATVVHGESRLLSTIKTPLYDESGRVWGVLGFARDISERELLLNETRALHEIGHIFNMVSQVDELLPQLMAGLQSNNLALAAGTASLLSIEIDADGEPDQAVTYAGWQSDPATPATKPGVRYPMKLLPMSSHLINNPLQPLIVNDINADERVDEATHQLMAARNVAAVVLLPLTVSGRWVGLLSISWPQPQSFSEREIQIYRLLMQQLSAVVDNLQLIDQARRRTEELEQANRFADSVIENLPNTLFVKEAENLQFVRWNRAAEKLFGYSREDMLGKNDYDLFPDNQADFFTAKDREVLANGVMLTIDEEPVQTAKNEIRFLRTTKVPIYDLDGKPRYLLGISEDITERKAAEAERDRLLTEVETAIRRYVAQEWEEFLDKHHHGNLHFEHQQPGLQLSGVSPRLAAVQAQVLQEGLAQIVSGQVDQTAQQSAALVAPVTLRSQVIGTLSLESIDPNRVWTAEEVALVEAVMLQLALTVENLRLVDATQRRAAHEAVARQITDKLHNASDIETILNTAVAELSRVLDGTSAFIDLAPNLTTVSQA